VNTACPRASLADGGICLLTPTGIDDAWVEQQLAPLLALRPGILQLRAKGRVGLPLARRIRELTRAAGTLLIVNDDVALAAACGADGVHLGREDMPLVRARRVLGDGAILGASCYGDLARAAASLEAGADYLAFGAIFASSTKPGAAVIGTGVLREARQRFAVPLFAIGGITPAGAADCRAAGAHWLAVVDAVWGSPDPAAALVALSAVPGGHASEGHVAQGP